MHLARKNWARVVECCNSVLAIDAHNAKAIVRRCKVKVMENEEERGGREEKKRKEKRIGELALVFDQAFPLLWVIQAHLETNAVHAAEEDIRIADSIPIHGLIKKG